MMLSIQKVDTSIRSFIQNKIYLYIYPTIFILGLIINIILPSPIFENLKEESWIVNSDNFINKHFAYKGNHIFAFLFTCVFIINIIEEFKLHQGHNSSGSGTKSTIQENQENEILMQLSWKKFKNFTIKFSLKMLILFILFWIIDHIFLATGGSCVIEKSVADILAKSSKFFKQCLEYNGTWVQLSTDSGFCSITPSQFGSQITSAQICYKYGEWEGGFDISGHFCFITTLSLILWYELKEFEECYFHGDNNKDLEAQKILEMESSWFSFTVSNVVRWSVLATLLLWMELLLVTATFYHTFWEKLLGLALGYVGPAFFYHVLPKMDMLHNILY